ncbi:MAG: hypothetical protein GY832_01050 [Chloroflexi bacterium]|nr:hypothetical protein [Chloroflexota bacterium]
MNTELKEHSNKNKSIVGFIGRFAVVHTIVYFIAGMIFAALMNYQEQFATISFMRPFEHPLVILGPSLQLFRGALLALAFLPFRQVIMENKRGWIYLFVTLLILHARRSGRSRSGKDRGVHLYQLYGCNSSFHLARIDIFEPGLFMVVPRLGEKPQG